MTLSKKIGTQSQPAAGDDEFLPSQGEVCVFPASLEQSRYWILDRLEAASTASNMAIAFRLEGPVIDALVERSLRELTGRHEALRTTFRMVDGSLSQVISEEPRFSFCVSDLRPLGPEEAETRAEDLVHEHASVAIDLATGPVFYVRLVHITDQRHLLAFTIHHIVCDGWSNGILVRDFATIYRALAEGREPFLPELPFQFADFTVWQQEWLESDAAQSALAFWHEHIQRQMPAVDLPVDRPRAAQKSYPGDIESQLLPGELTAKLKSYCRHNDATMHQVLLAAFEGLISRYAGQTEFLLGSTIANRTQPGMEHVVGRFANPQVILADLRGNPSYREVLKRVSDWSAKSYAHQDLPFSRLMEEFQLDQSGAASQFLQVYFVYQKAFMQPQTAGELKVIPRPSLSGGVNFDLLVSIVERAEGPRLQIEYNTALFERRRIRRLIEMYVRVLESVMDSDALKISQFPLLSPEEKSVLESAGGSAIPEEPFFELIREESIPAWLDRWTARRGDSLAILDRDRRIRWRDLHARSLEYARGLAQLGLTAGKTVALRMEPAADTAAVAWAILRLGAIVLPVPASTGLAEWNLILMELQPALSLARRSFTERFSALTSFRQVREAARAAASAPQAAEPAYPTAGDPAWLQVQTVASGHYRATAVSHCAALEAVLRTSQALDIQPGESILVWPAQASAETWTDLMLPLIAGAVTVHASNTRPDMLQALIDRARASFALISPAEAAAMLSGGWQGDPRLHLLCRGEGSSPAGMRLLSRFAGRIRVLHFSSTTASPFAIAHCRASHPEDETQSFMCPLAPLAGQQLTLLDAVGGPVPFGVTGELAVRQNGLAQRTGYLGRFSPGRGFELVDAADRQLRFHGYRLRLNDLDAYLYRNPEVASVETTVSRDGGAQVLTTYVVGKPGAHLSAEKARTELQRIAPGHLAATEIAVVESVPRRIDGSPNFSALSRANVSTPPLSRTSKAATVPPRDELERKLVAIWEEVLGVQDIGVRDSFFSLGGYSLMIVRLFARMNKMLGASLPITTIFNAPTIEQMAKVLRGNVSYSSLVPVQPDGTKAPFFLIHSYLIYNGLRTVLGDDRPFYGLRELDRDAEMTIDERVSSYVKEVRAVQPHGPYYLSGWCAAGPLAVEAARQLREAGEQVAMVMLFDSWRPGYAGELASAQSSDPQSTLRASLSRKYRFHRQQLAGRSALSKAGYLRGVVVMKLRSTRDRAFLRHWSMAQRLFTKFGLELPHFMHNISGKMLESVQEYRGKPYSGRITLIRATDAPYIPQADSACGWKTLAEQGVEVFFTPGTHESMFVEPNLTALGEILNNCFDRSAVDANPELAPALAAAQVQAE